jgi:putative transposase
MKKDYQTRTVAAATAVEANMPDAVSVTLAELVGSLREGLLALAVGAGFQVMAAIIDDSVCVLAGRRAATTGAGQRCVTAPRTAR